MKSAFGGLSRKGLVVAVLLAGAGVLASAPVSSAQPSVNAYSELNSVQCSSRSHCVAVGYTSTSTLAERLNGSSWSVVPSANPSGATEPELDSLSCWGVSSCMAVGSADDSSGYFPLAERFNGSKWQIVSTPKPAGVKASYFNSVACRSSSFCLAVVEGEIPHGYIFFSEKWNGSAWKLVGTARGVSDGYTDAIECTSTSDCYAVGSQERGSTNAVTLVEHWNGSAWKVVSVPTPSGTDRASLDALSCVNSASCMAVGSYFTNVKLIQYVFTETWNGKAWVIRKAVNSPKPTEHLLTGVDCVASSTCMAAGFVGFANYDTSNLAESWNGTGWKGLPTPSLGAAHSDQLEGLSCVSASYCIAIGGYGKTTSLGVTLAESWNGTSWKVMSTPN